MKRNTFYNKAGKYVYNNKEGGIKLITVMLTKSCLQFQSF